MFTYQITKNESFIDLQRKLMDQGVGNNNFMLQLNNPKLMCVDPFDPNLNDNQKRWIIEECMDNFWYFIREIVRWPLGDGTYIPTKLDRGNAAMYWTSLNGISTWRTNIRQTCSDLSVETLMLWIFLTRSNSRTNIISGDTFHNSQLERIKILYQHLPKMFSSIKNDIDSSGKHTKSIVNKNIYSDIHTISTPRNRDDARYILCGDRSEVMFFHMSEYIPELRELVINRAPFVSINNDCKRRINIFNSPYGVPANDTTIFAESYIEEMIKWKDSFYDCHGDELICAAYEYGNGVIYIKHNYEDLGYTVEWFDEMSKMLDNKNIMKEILLIRSAVGVSDNRKVNKIFI